MRKWGYSGAVICPSNRRTTAPPHGPHRQAVERIGATHDPPDVLNGILWRLRTGAPWKDLPERYPTYQTCHRRFQKWIEMIAPHRKNARKEKPPGRAQAASLREEMEDRAFICLVAELQEAGGSLREYKEQNFLGMAQLGCIVILLRKCL